MTQLTPKITAVAAAVLVIAGIGAALLLGSLDRIVRRGVETVGPTITGTGVSLGDVDISLFSGSGALEDLDIENPKGFASSYAFQLGEIAIEVNPASVMQDVVRIRSLVITRPLLTAEFDDSGHNNLRTILHHVRGAAGDDAQGGAPRRIIIEKFSVVDAEVRAIAAPFQLDKTLKLPPVELRNLGAKQGGAGAATIAHQAMRPIVEAAIRAARDEYLDAKADQLKQKFKDKAGSLLDGLRN